MDNEVQLIGTYGGDKTHAGSAWTSTYRDLSPEKIARIPALLKDLAGLERSDPPHTSPFEKSTIHFLLKTDIATHIHIIKHRIGVSVNAESARYKEIKEDNFYVPVDWPDDLKERYSQGIRVNLEVYHGLVDELVTRGFTRARAKESARFVRPYGSQITSDVMFNFLSFMHFQHLRNESHAQLEVREVAQKMLELVRETHQFDASLAAFGYERYG